jgi:lipopolysaccharide/colanic/teichoic acid biosynthesis glycosyltransferase
MTTLRRVRLAPPSPVPVERVWDRTGQPAALVSRRKRALDIVAAIVLLVLSSPIWLSAALIIKLKSPGPVLFRQERIGLNGTPFTCFKFRTMHHGSSDAAHRELVVRMIEADDTPANGKAFKLDRDARVIGAARWLRSTSLDELPQLLNVLRGEMSIVGPRPPIPYEIEHYQDWHHERLTVRPGITGLWQVSGRNRLTFNQMCQLDIQYIHEWTALTDVKIMVMTPWVMFVDHGGAA